jgi:hypothetical protein
MRTYPQSRSVFAPVVIFMVLLVGAQLFGAPSDPPKPLDNEAILSMLSFKVSQAAIVAAITANEANTRFSLTPESLKALTDAGATDAILDAMFKATRQAAKTTKRSGAEVHAQAPAKPLASQQTTEAPAGTDTQKPQEPLNGPPLPPPGPPPSGQPVSTPASNGASANPHTNSGTGGSTSGGPASASSSPAQDPRIEAAKVPVRHAVRGVARQPQGETGVFFLDWDNGSATPDTVYESGNHVLRLVGANTILYTYRFEVKEIRGGGDDLSLWKDLIANTTNILPQAKLAQAPSDACTLVSTLPPAKDALTSINTKIQQMLPARPPGGDYKSIPFKDSQAAWNDIRKDYDHFEDGTIEAVQQSLKNDKCRDADEKDNLAAALRLILEVLPEMRNYVEEIQQRADSPWVDFPVSLNRTSEYDITATEYFQHAATQAKPQKFHLNRGFDVLTLSGGFLFTKLQARSYAAVSQPVPPPAGSPPNTLPTSQTVLGVSGLGRGMRPTLVALFNYHAPWRMGKLNTRDFGFAFSVGPVIEIASGKADTSKFGAFVGGSYHLWQRLFVTAGVHFGEFADFPQGFNAPGNVLPANFGTLSPVKRWTGRFALAVTFQGKDLSGLTPQGSGKAGAAANPPPAATSPSGTTTPKP